MSYLVIARKYRPQSFNDLLGQEHITRTLLNALKSNKIAHAYLFSGIRGVGKTTVARILAKAVNCLTPLSGEPCNKCDNCLSISDGTANDIFEIDGASNRGIDEIRQLRENVKYLPAYLKSKIYIIDEVHMLTHDAFNALLKTLEEPPPSVIFILATTEYHKVPETILSRCQKFDFRRISEDAICKYLSYIAKCENIEIDEESLMIISRQSQGSMRDGQSLLDQASAYSNGKINTQLLNDMLGLFDRRILFDCLTALFTSDRKKIIGIVEDLYNDGHNLLFFLSELLVILKNTFYAASFGDEEGIFDLPSNEKIHISKIVEFRTPSEIDQMLEILFKTYSDMQKHEFKKILLEVNLLRCAMVESYSSIRDILSKLESIDEQKPSKNTDEKIGSLPSKENIVRAEKSAQASWKGFLQFLKQKKPTLYAFLEIGKVAREDEGGVTLHYRNSSFYQDKIVEYGKILDLYLNEFYGREIKLAIEEDGSVEAEEKIKISPEAEHILKEFDGRIIKIES